MKIYLLGLLIGLSSFGVQAQTVSQGSQLKKSTEGIGRCYMDECTWLKVKNITANYNHRHYIQDNEYIPFDRSTDDKTAYIKAVLAKEIDYEIIDWEEVEELGYEILPNKYFYKYQEPENSDALIEQFWQLEEEATQLLAEIKALEGE